jgi:hypothetical protein
VWNAVPTLQEASNVGGSEQVTCLKLLLFFVIHIAIYEKLKYGTLLLET